MSDRLVNWGLLALFAGFTAFAIGGFGYYSLRPENLPQTEFALRFFARSQQLFGIGHIVAASVVLFAMLVARAGARWIPALLGTVLVAFTAEHVGTGFGFPFGDYSYTALLGTRIGDRVPLVIPVSWFLMALPSWVLARSLLSEHAPRWSRVLLASALLTAWDLALDPAMSFLTTYWVWGVEGRYYGMPAVNILGWLFTGVLIMAVLEVAGAERWTESVDVRWIATYYGIMIALPVGMLAAAGLWLGVGVTLATVAALVGVARVVGVQSRPLAPTESPV